MHRVVLVKGWRPRNPLNIVKRDLRSSSRSVPVTFPRFGGSGQKRRVYSFAFKTRALAHAATAKPKTTEGDMGLTLKRRAGDRIRIGVDVFVEIVSVGRGDCKVRIDAPADLKILREELLAMGGRDARDAG